MSRRSEASEFTAKFGERLRALRIARKMSLVALADASGLSKEHLSCMEYGLAAVTAETVERLARGLGLPALYIFAFPDEDDRAKIAELIVDFPPNELVQLRKELAARGRRSPR